jgi:hypothetical protein
LILQHVSVHDLYIYPVVSCILGYHDVLHSSARTSGLFMYLYMAPPSINTLPLDVSLMVTLKVTVPPSRILRLFNIATYSFKLAGPSDAT